MFKFYNKDFKYYMLVPLIFMLLFIYLIFINPSISKGIDLEGGNQIIVHYKGERDYSTLESRLTEDYELSEIKINQTKTPSDYGLLIEFSLQPDIENIKLNRRSIDFENTNLDELKIESKSLLQPLVDKELLRSQDLLDLDKMTNNSNLKEEVNQKIALASNNFNTSIINLIKEELNLEDTSKLRIREVAATLGSDFTKSSINVGIWAFILLVIVILLFFKEIIPSALILFSAVFDIFAALAGMAIFNLPLSLTTIPALLMLIGYSVDTDILLSTRLLKDKKDPYASANKSMITGLTMTITTFLTVLAMLIVSYYTQMLVIFEIATVLLCGLIGDLISTWFFNAPALINYVNKKKSK